MNILVYLLPMALTLGLAGLFAFLWSLRTGQYDDLEGAALRLLDDEDIDASNTDARAPLPPSRHDDASLVEAARKRGEPIRAA